MKVAAILALGIACLSCAERQAGPTHQNETKSSPVAAASTPQGNGVEALRRRLAVAQADAEQRFVDPLFGNTAGPLIARARAEWQRRIEDCPDDRCRTRLISDQLNRIEYSRARNRRAIAGLPWPTGVLSISAPAIPFGTHEGSIAIWPIIDDRLVIAYTSMLLPTEQMICGMIAEGLIHSGQIIRVRALDEDGRSFVFRPVGTRRLTIDADRPDRETFECIAGHYEVELLGPEEL